MPPTLFKTIYERAKHQTGWGTKTTIDQKLKKPKAYVVLLKNHTPIHLLILRQPCARTIPPTRIAGGELAFAY
jgi:hypothetical protein